LANALYISWLFIQLIGLLSYRIRLAKQMVGKYGWMFQRSGALGWSARSSAE